MELIVSLRAPLIACYGVEGLERIDLEVESLIQALKRDGVEARMIWLDDEHALKGLGLNPVKGARPETIREILGQLEERVGGVEYILLLGGDGAIPFFRLPDPTEDDPDIGSDSPYASRDEEYLIPERALGRLPDGGKLDFFLWVIRNAARCHRTGGNPDGFGYSAAVWIKASEAVYGVIDRNPLRSSPPTDINSFDPDWLSTKGFAYFNLHGAKGSPYWYGQEGSLYPRALSAKLVQAAAPGRVLVYTEACYGGYLNGIKPEESIVMSFLAEGAIGVVGSTRIAYGPPRPPSREADLLGRYFLQYAAQGVPLGSALLNAKKDFARKMLRVQGYLDEDDQKTLLEFVLYGDPSLKAGG